MADFEEPKAFAFGDLNPIAKPRAAPTFDPKNISVMDALREVILGHYTSDSMANTGPYKGIVLRVEEDMDQNNPTPGNWLSNIFGPQGMFDGLTAPKKLKRYKVRIPEIHVTLPIPSKFAATPQETGPHQATINMYPTFIAKDSNAEQAGPGDLVWVDYGHKGNFDDPTFIGPVFPPPESGSGGADSASAMGAFGACGAGGSLPMSSGGSLVPDQRNKVTTKEAPWANAIYLPRNTAKARNDQPSAGRNILSGGRPKNPEKVKAYVEKGGSGRAVSGRVALGSCSTIGNALDAYCTALRIAVEDQADRGYVLGGKGMDPSKGGIDCSGFVHAVRNIAEWLLSPDGTYYGLPDYKDNKWTSLTTHSSSQWTAASVEKNSEIEWSNIAGDKERNWFEVEGQAGTHIMPGDEIAYAGKPPPPDFAKTRKHGISHVVMVFADPNGELRVAESAGYYKGTGSQPLADYLSRCRNGKKLWIWQRAETKKLWADNGNRQQPWSKDMLGEEYFSAPNLASQSEGTNTPKEQQVEGVGATDGNVPTSTEKPSETVATDKKLTYDEEYELQKSVFVECVKKFNAEAQKLGLAASREEEGVIYVPALSNGTTLGAGELAKAHEAGTARVMLASVVDGVKVAEVTYAQVLRFAQTPTEQAEVMSLAAKDTSQQRVIKSFEKILSNNQLYKFDPIGKDISSKVGDSFGEQVGTQASLKLHLACQSLLQKYKLGVYGENLDIAHNRLADKGKAYNCDIPTAASSTAAAGVNPSPTSSPVPSGGCGAGGGGGSYTPGAPFTISADRAGTPLGDTPFVGVLGEIRTNPKMKLIPVPMDKTRQPTGGNHPYYASKAKVREDMAQNMVEVKRIMNELGAVMTSSGASRRLSAKVGPGRSATSFHYTSLAFDFTLPAMMSNPDVDEHVIEFDPVDNKQFIFWSRSNMSSGSVTKGGVTFEVEHKTLNAIDPKKGAPPTTRQVTGYFVNVTKIMRAHGLERIGGRKSWYSKSKGASEAWHFDLRKNAGLTVGKTTFGDVLRTIHDPSGHPPWAQANRTWRGGSF